MDKLQRLISYVFPALTVTYKGKVLTKKQVREEIIRINQLKISDEKKAGRIMKNFNGVSVRNAELLIHTAPK